MVAIIVLTLAITGFFFRDVIYTKIQIQVFRYQMRRAVDDMLHQQAMITPTLIPESKRGDIGLISSEQRDRPGRIEVVGRVQNFDHRPYAAIEV